MADRRSLDEIEQDFREARKRGDTSTIARLRNEEACVVLLTLLGRLAADESSFIHEVALKGGILMAGELGSPRASADIDVTTGRMRRMDDEQIVEDLQAVGRDFGLRRSGVIARTPGGSVIHLSFESRTDRGSAKLEVSVREDLVFAVRDAYFDVSDIGLDAFSLPALAEVEIVSEKLRTLVQRAQPRDLFDLRLQLVDARWHLDPIDLRRALEAKLSITRHRQWRTGLWTNHLEEIAADWVAVLEDWIEPDRIPGFDETVGIVARRMRDLGLD